MEERKLMTEAFRAKVDAAETMTALEDIYQPFKPKKKTKKRPIARDLGLEPLAEILWARIRRLIQRRRRLPSSGRR